MFFHHNGPCPVQGEKGEVLKNDVLILKRFFHLRRIKFFYHQLRACANGCSVTVEKRHLVGKRFIQRLSNHFKSTIQFFVGAGFVEQKTSQFARVGFINALAILRRDERMTDKLVSKLPGHLHLP